MFVPECTSHALALDENAGVEKKQEYGTKKKATSNHALLCILKFSF